MRAVGFRTRLAIEHYRLVHNTLPPSLEAFVPTFIGTVPIDPCSGLPLVYKQQAVSANDPSGYILYSTGTDKADNGGFMMAGSISGQVYFGPRALNTDTPIQSQKPKHPLLLLQRKPEAPVTPAPSAP